MDLSFFITSNIGGGGQTVPRLFSYLIYLNDLPYNNINILLNYRYLTFYKNNKYRKEIKPIFNSKILKKLDNGTKDFSKNLIKEVTIDNKINNRVSKLSKNQINTFLPKILMDSGSGAIANNLIIDHDYDKHKIKKFLLDLISDHSEYIEKNNCHYSVAIDFSLKNTYKKNASDFIKSKYKEIMNELINDIGSQNLLLKKSLELETDKTKLIAPIHGNSPDDFIDHYKKIIDLENKVGKKFFGFALGGLAKISKKKNGYSIVGNIIKNIRGNYKEKRHIHVLGSADIKSIPTLVIAGANSFDCHTAWRRANDNEKKILIPLLNMNGKFNKNSIRPLQYVDLEKINDDTYFCDCPICNEFSIKDLKKMIKNRKSNQEDYFLSVVLIYLHAVYQHSLLIGKLGNSDNIFDFIHQIPEKYIYKRSINSSPSSFKDKLINEVSLLN